MLHPRFLYVQQIRLQGFKSYKDQIAYAFVVVFVPGLESTFAFLLNDPRNGLDTRAQGRTVFARGQCGGWPQWKRQVQLFLGNPVCAVGQVLDTESGSLRVVVG